MTAAGGSALFAGVDQAQFVSSFAAALRRTGVAVPVGSVARAADAFAVIANEGVDPVDLHWVLRITLVSRQEDLVVFDELFAAVFDFELNRSVKQRRPVDAADATVDGDELRSVSGVDPSATADGEGLPWATRPRASAEQIGGDDDDTNEIPELLPAAAVGRGDTPFDRLDEEELRSMSAAIAEAAADWPSRVSRRRHRRSSGDRVDRRDTLRRSMRTGGEVVDWSKSRATRRERRLVLVVDVSGSMESFVAPYLHVTRALAVERRAEVFAFSTHITRITPALRRRSATEAIEQATDDVGDRFGGTRLASSLRTLLRHRVWGGLVRGSVVVIVSDGWDSEPPVELATIMAKLARRSHRVLWVNPRVAAPGFEPLVGGLAAALPFCDRLLSGHSANAMREVLAAIGARD